MKFVVFLLIIAVGLPAYAQNDESTLSRIKARGKLNCGVNGELPGFSAKDEADNWAGLDVDLCRAIAAAIFNDDTKVHYVALDATERFNELDSGNIDVLARNSTWNLTRDTELGLDFAGINFYDGQGFLVKRDSRILQGKDFDGHTVCVQGGSTSATNLYPYFKSLGVEVEVTIVDKHQDGIDLYANDECQSYTSDRSALSSLLSKMDNPEEHSILEETISREPLGPVVSHGDNEWTDIVRWVLMATIVAEYLGVTQANSEQMREQSSSPEIQALLGKKGNFGELLGLDNEWAYHIVYLVGNYGESYENNVGPKTSLRLERGMNRLWTEGGLMYALPF